MNNEFIIHEFFCFFVQNKNSMLPPRKPERKQVCNLESHEQIKSPKRIKSYFKRHGSLFNLRSGQCFFQVRQRRKFVAKIHTGLDSSRTKVKEEGEEYTGKNLDER